MEIKKIKFDSHSDDRGSLVALEELKNIPFDIKRVYYMYGTVPNQSRGLHAHKCLEQVLLCLSGSCKLLLDDGTDKDVIELGGNPSVGVYIANNIWREMYDFSKDCVLMVVASEYYNEEDYIRDYNEFLKYVGK